jgi:uncharacterized protein
MLMRYAILFTDEPDRAAIRQELMPAHLDFLERNRNRIRAAGPLREADNGAPAGGLWVVDAEDRAAAVALYQSDPFWPTGLRRAVRVLEWSQVFANGRRRS